MFDLAHDRKGTLWAALGRKAGAREDFARARAADRGLAQHRRHARPARLLRPHSRTGRRPPRVPPPARRGSRRRARRIPGADAGLRADQRADAARLPRVAGGRRFRREARHRDAARRGARDDGARRQGTGGRHRVPDRQRHAAFDPGLRFAHAVARRRPRPRQARAFRVDALGQGDARGAWAERVQGEPHARRGRVSPPALRRHDARQGLADRRRHDQAEEQQRPALARAGQAGAGSRLRRRRPTPTATRRWSGARSRARRRRPRRRSVAPPGPRCRPGPRRRRQTHRRRSCG